MFGCFQLFATNFIISYYLSGAFTPGNQIHTVIKIIQWLKARLLAYDMALFSNEPTLLKTL